MLLAPRCSQLTGALRGGADVVTLSLDRMHTDDADERARETSGRFKEGTQGVGRRTKRWQLF